MVKRRVNPKNRHVIKREIKRSVKTLPKKRRDEDMVYLDPTVYWGG